MHNDLSLRINSPLNLVSTPKNSVVIRNEMVNNSGWKNKTTDKLLSSGRVLTQIKEEEENEVYEEVKAAFPFDNKQRSDLPRQVKVSRQ